MELYLKQIWQFRDAPLPAQKSLIDYDISTSCIFVVEKFRAIRSLLTSKNPSFWAAGKHKRFSALILTSSLFISFSLGEFDTHITATEFQKRSWPHWHIMLRLNLPWDIENINQQDSNIADIIEFFDSYISTDSTKTTYSHVQLHGCRPRCFTGRNKKTCRYGFPKIPFSK